ncbi:UNVERIFIED_CONTAM: hypothetical protein Slati_2737500 [Sesamum latifolium]|uniref:Uncharacterized protein n=1 Tax=Sesamum latifolium TaxID=2727402 RepID=A0AAW2VXA8_9LAMI
MVPVESGGAWEEEEGEAVVGWGGRGRSGRVGGKGRSGRVGGRWLGMKGKGDGLGSEAGMRADLVGGA